MTTPVDYGEIRNFSILIKDTNGNYVKNCDVMFTVTNTLPFIIMKDKLIQDVNYNTVTTTPIVEDMFLASGIDEVNYMTNPDTYPVPNGYVYNFKYIGSVRSSVSNNTVRLYYDFKYKDIIVVPELSYMVDPELPNIQYAIKGHRIGSGASTIQNYTVSLSVETKTDLPAPITTITTKHYAMALNGLNQRLGNRQMVYPFPDATSANTEVIDSYSNPVGVLDIGDFATLFGQDTNVGIYNLYMDSSSTYRLISGQNRVIKKAYVLFDF